MSYLPTNRIDIVAAANRHHCSTQAIWRRIRQGSLPARKEKMIGRDGRPVINTLVRVSDLNDVFGWAAHRAARPEDARGCAAADGGAESRYSEGRPGATPRPEEQRIRPRVSGRSRIGRAVFVPVNGAFERDSHAVLVGAEADVRLVVTAARRARPVVVANQQACVSARRPGCPSPRTPCAQLHQRMPMRRYWRFFVFPFQRLGSKCR